MASELSAEVLETSITRDNVWLKTKEKKSTEHARLVQSNIRAHWPILFTFFHKAQKSVLLYGAGDKKAVKHMSAVNYSSFIINAICNLTLIMDNGG